MQPNHFHPPFVIDCTMSVRRSKQNCNVSHKRVPAGEYAVQYNALSNCDWPSLYNDTSADAAIERLNVAVSQTLDLAVPCGQIKKHKYPAWFSGKLKAFIEKKNYFYRCYKYLKTDCFYDRFSFAGN
jgi:hypothetical protein